MDTTFFGREFGVLVMVDSLSEKVIYHQIVSSERDEYYQLALNRFRNKNDDIQSVTCDGRRGLLKDLLKYPNPNVPFPFSGNGNEKVEKKA